MKEPNHAWRNQLEVNKVQSQLSREMHPAWVWDAGKEAAPTEELQDATRQVFAEIKRQPFFGNSVLTRYRNLQAAQTERYHNIIEWADKYIKKEDKMMNHRNVENECNDQCNLYAARKNITINPTGRIDNQPGECQICFLNPSFVDNFEQKEMSWPPEKGQKIWCISATGQVYKREYDSEFKSTVMCYVTEHLANGALDTLLRARGMRS